MKHLDIPINVKAWSILLATFFFMYQYIGFGIEIRESIELPYCNYNIFLFSLSLWLITWANFSRFEFANTRWVKPITACFICAVSYCIGEFCGIAQSHFSYGSIIQLLVIVGAIVQRENIKWFLEKKNKPILYFIFGLILTWK